MFKWLRRLFYTRIKKIELIPNTQYLWMFEDPVSQQQLHQFRHILAEARKSSHDIVAGGTKFKIIPASSLKLTMEHSEFKSKTQLMKTINAALGKGEDWKNVAKIELDEGILKVEKYYSGEKEWNLYLHHPVDGQSPS